MEGNACLLGQTQITLGVAGLVGMCLPEDFSLDIKWFPCLSQFVYLSREGCASSRGVLFHIVFVFAPSDVECSACHSDIVPRLVSGGNDCLVDNILGSAPLFVSSDNFAWFLIPLY